MFNVNILILSLFVNSSTFLHVCVCVCTETKRLYKTAAECGQCYPVALPEFSAASSSSLSSALYTREEVRFVVHCLPPNMNRDKPDCLDGDYDKGCRLLYETYTNLFKFFGAMVEWKINIFAIVFIIIINISKIKKVVLQNQKSVLKLTKEFSDLKRVGSSSNHCLNGPKLSPLCSNVAITLCVFSNKTIWSLQKNTCTTFSSLFSLWKISSAHDRNLFFTIIIIKVKCNNQDQREWPL